VEYSADVREYWEETTGLYLEHGTTFQAGYIRGPDDRATARASNLYLASRAGIGPGQRVLDAGCGVCGPSIDIVRGIGDLRVDAVTLSPLQAKLARETIRHAGLEQWIDVYVCDYHELPFEAERFDVVFFLESLYSVDLSRLFAEVHRVLRPGGRVYAKEVFRREGPLSPVEQPALDEFEDVFHYKVRLMSETATTAAAAGFEQVECTDLNPLASTEHYARAMTEFVCGFPRPTAFGRRHYRRFPVVPVMFGEVRARKRS
jgi:cyclopropane fatty-acyl-phospholipid synthase-like methyltransferase